MHRSIAACLIAALCMAMTSPVFADHHDDDERHGRYDDNRYSYEPYREDHYEHRHHDGRYRDNACRVEGWYDRAGYYHERQVCPEPQVIIQVPTPPLPFPPGIPLPPGLRFR